ncbi:glycerophosphodiester phosphodiesterase [Zooshikella marina]|uniref:glycerophosphodiester phosphodiesterase n=1 Tax=Zooshikella ganghwensis TaxID=202772 RepID=UPI001BB07ED4|nr:glycerophosphodiester phosphodiesterase [Zooshikella ganghwensis]MBU2707636.1 glycerophosphodiester phosphodiesterase [Zooshikella ganghwensis]
MKRLATIVILLLVSLYLIPFTITTLSAPPVAPSIIQAQESPLVIAHRGGKGLWPENTLFAFNNAIKLGVDMLEMDVRSTADGTLIIMHDPQVDRTTNGQGKVSDLSWKDLQQLDAGYYWTNDKGQTYPYRNKGITIPSLSAVLTSFPEKPMVIEIKEAGIEQRVCDTIRKHNMQQHVIIGSFIAASLHTFREACPKVATSATHNEVKNMVILDTVGLGHLYRPPAIALQVPEYYEDRLITSPSLLATASQHQLWVQVWTVNDTTQMQRLIKQDINGIITDYPDRLINLKQQFFLKPVQASNEHAR